MVPGSVHRKWRMLTLDFIHCASSLSEQHCSSFALLASCRRDFKYSPFRSAQNLRPAFRGSGQDLPMALGSSWRWRSCRACIRRSSISEGYSRAAFFGMTACTVNHLVIPLPHFKARRGSAVTASSIIDGGLEKVGSSAGDAIAWIDGKFAATPSPSQFSWCGQRSGVPTPACGALLHGSAVGVGGGLG
jgi:hypothetical protein